MASDMVTVNGDTASWAVMALENVVDERLVMIEDMIEGGRNTSERRELARYLEDRYLPALADLAESYGATYSTQFYTIEYQRRIERFKYLKEAATTKGITW